MKISKKTFDELQSLNTGMLTEDGKELFNPMPLEIPSGLKKPESLEDRIAALIKGKLSEQARQQEYETLEEADDFTLDDPLVCELSGFELAEDEIPIAPDDPDPTKPDPPDPQPKIDIPEPDPIIDAPDPPDPEPEK